MTSEFLEEVSDPLQDSFSRTMTLLFLSANSLATDRPIIPPSMITDSEKTVSILKVWVDKYIDTIVFYGLLQATKSDYY